MAGPLHVDFDEEELRILEVLTEAGHPLEVVELASAARLPVGQTQEIVGRLVDKGVAVRREPEPIRTRVEVEDEALRAAG